MYPLTIGRVFLTVTLMLIVSGTCVRSGRDLGNIAPNNQSARDIEGDQAAIKASAQVQVPVDAAIAKIEPTSQKTATSQAATADNGGVAAPQTTDTDTTQSGVVNTAITVAGGGLGALATLALWLRHTRLSNEHARAQQTIRMELFVMIIMAMLQSESKRQTDG